MRVRFECSLLADDGVTCVTKYEECEFANSETDLRIQCAYMDWVHEHCAQGWYVIYEGETKTETKERE